MYACYHIQVSTGQWSNHSKQKRVETCATKCIDLRWVIVRISKVHACAFGVNDRRNNPLFVYSLHICY
jgi:hypothetical protein